MQQPLAIDNPSEANVFRRLGFPALSTRFSVAAILILIALYFASLYNFLLFHVLVEIFCVIVAFAIFMFAWNARDNIQNGSLVLLGAAYLVIGAVDLLHTLSYEGMGVFENAGADTATQLWIAARYIESLTLAATPLFATRLISLPRTMAFYAVPLALVIATVFIWPVFPACFVAGTGLTPFKKVSEYFISAILVVGLILLIRRRVHFDSDVFGMLAAAIGLTIIAELMFTFYIDVYGISNLVGHYFKLGSFWLIYKAIIETGLQRPYALLFRELAQSEKRYRDLVDTMPTGICEIKTDGSITYINPAGLKMIGYTEADLARGINLDMILCSEDRAVGQRRLRALFQSHTIESTEYRFRRKNGNRAHIIVNTTPAPPEGEPGAIQASLTDVTELHQLENRLQQARKMEAVAILAGGMAHEINNALMGVVGRIELIKFDVANRGCSDADFAGVLGGCERIAKLVKHLLAYSRGGRYRSEVIDMTAFIPKILSGIEKHLQPGIRLTYKSFPGLPNITVDPVQLDMVVTAIVSNSVEAIVNGGRIEIDLQCMDIDAVQSMQRPGLQPGQYVRLRVRDTGKGMDAETLERIFEPFYTSKFQGRGLGMSAVYGIIKNHAGWVGVDSKPGQGTTVQVYLPVQA